MGVAGGGTALPPFSAAPFSLLSPFGLAGLGRLLPAGGLWLGFGFGLGLGAGWGTS
jgi:hypothetical protein